MTDQGTFFGAPELKPWQRSIDPLTKARGSDPDTSHIAARTNLPGRVTQRGRILEVLALDGPLTDDEVSQRLPDIRLNSLTTRRSELVALGLAYDTGERRRTVAGVPAVVWASTDDGMTILEGHRSGAGMA